MSFRPRRAAPSALNSAVIAHVTGVRPVDQARAEAILSKFISTSEAIAVSGASEAVAFSPIGLSNTSGNNPILGQLKRVQRDLRGLPPLLAELDSPKRPADESTEEPRSKKIKFSDDEGLAHEEQVVSDMSVDGSEPEKRQEELAEEPVEPPKKAEESAKESEDEQARRERKRQKKLAKKEKKEKNKQLHD